MSKVRDSAACHQTNHIHRRAEWKKMGSSQYDNCVIPSVSQNLVLQQMCVFSIVEAKTCVADTSSKPKTAAPPEPQAEPLAATWPVASPVATPAPTVEVKEEAKPEDTELRSLIRVKTIFEEKKVGIIWGGDQVFKFTNICFFCF